MQSDLTSKDTVIFKPYFKIQLASTSTVDKISSRGKKLSFLSQHFYTSVEI